MGARPAVLVTGVTGFIGSAFARWLLNRGVRVFGLVRQDSAHHQRLQELAGLEVVSIGSQKPSELSAALAQLPIDAVFNLAAYGVSQKQQDYDAIVQGNIGLLADLLHAVPRLRRPVTIHCGSCFEYGAAKAGTLLNEDAAIHPESLYGAAKACSVLMGRALASRLQLPLVVLRLFGVYGPGEADERLIPSLISHLGREEPLDLTPGRQVRDLLFVDDVCAAMWAAANAPTAQTGGIFNVCSGIPVTVREIGNLIAQQLERPSDLLRWGARAYRTDEPMWLVGDSSRFQAATGWAPVTSLSDGLHKTITHALARTVKSHSTSTRNFSCAT